MYVEHQGQIGMFDAEIFKKWKQTIVKMNDYKKIELIDIFKRLDERKRGVIKADVLLKDLSILVPEYDYQRFEELITRYYAETKITESLFIRLMMNFYSNKWYN